MSFGADFVCDFLFFFSLRLLVGFVAAFRFRRFFYRREFGNYEFPAFDFSIEVYTDRVETGLLIPSARTATP